MWFLFDENLSPAYSTQLKARLPSARIGRVGDADVPTYGTKDPVLLRWCETHAAVLVTADRATIPMHVADHIKKGGHLPGILIVRPRAKVGDVLDAVELVAGAVSADDLKDQCLYIPI